MLGYYFQANCIDRWKSQSGHSIPFTGYSAEQSPLQEIKTRVYIIRRSACFYYLIYFPWTFWFNIQQEGFWYSNGSRIPFNTSAKDSFSYYQYCFYRLLIAFFNAMPSFKHSWSLSLAAICKWAYNKAGYTAQDAPSTRLKITLDRPTDGHTLL